MTDYITTTEFAARANTELDELAKLMDYPFSKVEKVRQAIECHAHDHRHMQVSAFVDMCITLAGV